MGLYDSLMTKLPGGPRRAAARHVEQGKALAMQKRDEEAAREFQAAIGLDPTFAEAHCLLGVALMGVSAGVGAGKNVDSGRYEAALSAFREAIRLDPADGRAWGHLGEALNILEQHAEAVRALEESRRLDPTRFGALQSFRRRLECSLEGKKWDGIR
jgi:Flp pilus assembly protein TadD